MSVPVAIGDNVGGALCLSNRPKSLGDISNNSNDYPTNGEVTPSSSGISSFSVRELSLSNGDFFSGSILSDKPEGSGKYVWSDKCMCKGECRRGIWHGYGKLQWPSGAIYEGDFSGGYMHGTGTYIRPDKMIYKGKWRLSLKHGLGYQKYPNGDVFEGAWIQGTPEGPGKYSWVSGNIYLGNMKGGKMSGKGTLTWTIGDLYEGSWSTGMMHGFGVYKWSDGGHYVGTWTGLERWKRDILSKRQQDSSSPRSLPQSIEKTRLAARFKKTEASFTHSACFFA